MVVFRRDMGRLLERAPFVAFPSEIHSCVYRDIITVQFPHARNRKIHPAFVVEIRLPEAFRTCVRMFHPVEFPVPVQAHEVSGQFFHSFCRQFRTFVGKKVGVHGGTVDGIDLRVLPLLECLCVGMECAYA